MALLEAGRRGRGEGKGEEKVEGKGKGKRKRQTERDRDKYLLFLLSFKIYFKTLVDSSEPVS